MDRFGSYAALLALALVCAGPATAQTVSALGQWIVTGVRNDPSMTVTALLDDDPAYMGAGLGVTPTSIVWSAGSSNGQGTFEDCPGPRFVPSTDVPGGLDVLCGAEPWGPRATLQPHSRNRMDLDWYDGGILTLTRR